MLDELIKARAIAKLLIEAFPDETLKQGQKLRKDQVEILNLAIMIHKYGKVK